jgi:hypothetical protein
VGAFPLIQIVRLTPIKINYKKTKLEFGEASLTIADDRPLALANPYKKSSRTEEYGTFINNLFKRHSNWYLNEVEIYNGEVDDEENDFDLTFVGVMEDLKSTKTGYNIHLIDVHGKTNHRSHNKTDNRVKVDGLWAGVGDLDVFNGNQLEEYGVIRISVDGNKYIKYNGITYNAGPGNYTLENADYCFDTGGNTPNESEIQQILAYSKDDGYDIDNNNNPGLEMDWVLMDLLCFRSKIPYNRFRWDGYGQTLTSGINATTTTIPITGGTTDLPTQGIILIDEEVILYTSKDANNLYTDTGEDRPLYHEQNRGHFGTPAASHDSGKTVYLSQFSKEKQTNFSGWLFKRTIRQPQLCRNLLNDMVQSILSWPVPDNTCTLVMKSLVPPPEISGLPTWKDLDNILENSVKVDDNNEERSTRTQIYFKPYDGEDNPGKSFDKYQVAYVYTDYELELPQMFGEPKIRHLFAPFLYRETEASACAQRWQNRFGPGTFEVMLRATWRDDEWPGDFVRVTTEKLSSVSGAPLEDRICQIISRERLRGEFKYIVVDVRFTLRYGHTAKAEPELNIGINDSITTIQVEEIVDVLGNASFAYADVETTGAIRICNADGTWEDIKFTGKTSETYGFDLTGCTRGFNNTLAASHSAGDKVLLLYAGATESAQELFEWIGTETDNLVFDVAGATELEFPEDGYFTF